MRDFLQQPKGWVLLFLVLIFGNLYLHWPRRTAPPAHDFGPPPMLGDGAMPAPTPEMEARMAERLQKMTPERRAKFEARRQADQAFFASVRTLPEAERRQQMQEYFAQNPPGGPDDPDDDDNGGPGNGPMHLPPVDRRRAMDQQIVTLQRSHP